MSRFINGTLPDIPDYIEVGGVRYYPENHQEDDDDEFKDYRPMVRPYNKFNEPSVEDIRHMSPEEAKEHLLRELTFAMIDNIHKTDFILEEQVNIKDRLEKLEKCFNM